MEVETREISRSKDGLRREVVHIGNGQGRRRRKKQAQRRTSVTAFQTRARETDEWS